MATMTAYRLHSWGRPGELATVPVPDPGPRDVLLRVGGAGACQSDLHLMHEFTAESAPWAPGFTLGHENAGWVAGVGSDVRRFTEGDAVAVMGSWGCGSCARCRLGADPYCDDVVNAPAPGGGGGLGLDGGMAEFMVVRDADRHLVALPRGLAPDQAASLTDAGLTPYHAIRHSLPILTDPTSTVLVIGVGGLGGFAVQILDALTAATVVAVDTRTSALDRATTDGADHVFAPGATTAADIRDLTGGRGVDVVIDFVGAATTLELGAAVVRPLGDLTIVGAGGGTTPVGFGGAAPAGVAVRTSFWGGLHELGAVVDLAARGLLRPRTTTYKLDQVDRAYRDLADGHVDGRAVIVP